MFNETINEDLFIELISQNSDYNINSLTNAKLTNPLFSGQTTLTSIIQYSLSRHSNYILPLSKVSNLRDPLSDDIIPLKSLNDDNFIYYLLLFESSQQSYFKSTLCNFNIYESSQRDLESNKHRFAPSIKDGQNSNKLYLTSIGSKCVNPGYY